MCSEEPVLHENTERCDASPFSLSQFLADNRWLVLLWCSAFCSVVGMFLFLPDRCWDLRVSTQALDYVRRGLDPYLASISYQKIEQALGHHVFIYWYPPVTVEFLKLFNLIPAPLRGAIFWVIYAAGFGLQLYAGSRLVFRSEWRIVRYLLPLVVFFPGCVPSDTILSGNFAIPLLGLILFTCVRAFETKRWYWFYAAVLAGSLVKPPLLLWLAVPLAVDLSEFLTTAFAATLGLAMFAVQRILYPQRFAEFLQSVRYALPMETNYSLSGVFNHLLVAIGRSSVSVSLSFYLTTALFVFLLLAYFSYEQHLGHIDRMSFFTVVLLGIVLMSPRLKEYDLLPLTIPVCLILLRSSVRRLSQVIMVSGACIATFAFARGLDDLVSVAILSSTFLCGCHMLLTKSLSSRTSAAEELEPELVAL